jgi:hypothetical protein
MLNVPTAAPAAVPALLLLLLLPEPGLTPLTAALVKLGGAVSGTSSPVRATTVGDAAWPLLEPLLLVLRRTAARTV